MKKALTLFVTAVALCLVGAYIFGFPPFPSVERVFLAQCDDVIRDRLKSPSSYVRITNTPLRTSPGDLMTFLGKDTPERRQSIEKSEANLPRYREMIERQTQYFEANDLQEVATVITYDAANGFGAILRGQAVCSEYVPSGQTLADAERLDPRIDNMTKMDWSLDQLRQAREALGG